MADNVMQTKIGYGPKTNLTTAIADGKLDSGDIVFTSDTHETAFIDENGSPLFMKSRSTKPYTLNGTTLGALNNGDTIPTDIDMDGLLTLITQKAIAPSYTKSTVSIANNGGTASGNYEAGTEITAKLKATFTKNDSNGLTSIAIKKGTNEVATGTASPLNYVEESTFFLGDETVTYVATADYQDAIDKTNNLGVIDRTNAFTAGTATSSNYNFVGQRNLFYGTGVGSTPTLTSSVIRDLANKKLNPSQGYSFNININEGQQYVIFAYPATLRDVNQVMYVETNDTGMAGNFTKTTVDVADARGGENGLKSYKVYSYAMATPAKAGMTFKVTI